MISSSCRNLTMLSMSQAGFFSGIWCNPMVSSLCLIKCPQSQIMWIGVSSFSPQSLQDTSPSGGLLLWSTMADCLRRNATPESILDLRTPVPADCNMFTQSTGREITNLTNTTKKSTIIICRRTRRAAYRARGFCRLVHLQFLQFCN
jgi:hypothetical protein